MLEILTILLRIKDFWHVSGARRFERICSLLIQGKAVQEKLSLRSFKKQDTALHPRRNKSQHFLFPFQCDQKIL
jgi:hypothetical protein